MSCDFDFRRDLRTLKLSVGNKSHPEGSIAERYVANECLIFCARYLPGVETKENRSSRNNDDGRPNKWVIRFGYESDQVQVGSCSG